MEVKKINIFLPVYLISYLILNIISAFIIGIITDAGITVPQWILYVLGEAIMIAVALIYILVMKIDIKRDMMYRKIGIKDILMSVLTGYLVIPMVLFINNITMLFSNNYLNESSEGLMAYPYIIQVILMAVIPPLVEEFVFRGLFYGTYRKYGILKAAVMSGLVFGVFHLNINQFAYAFVIGVVFSYMVEATGSIWSSVFGHFAVNTYSITVVQILKLCGLYDGMMAEPAGQQAVNIPVASRIMSFLMLFIVAFIFMLFAVLCIKNMAKRNARLDNIKNSFHIHGSEYDMNDAMQQEDITEQKTLSAGWHIMTAPAAVTLIACAFYMIVMEIIR